jgi:murein lipoprotein
MKDFSANFKTVTKLLVYIEKVRDKPMKKTLLMASGATLLFLTGCTNTQHLEDKIDALTNKVDSMSQQVNALESQHMEFKSEHQELKSLAEQAKMEAERANERIDNMAKNISK